MAIADLQKACDLGLEIGCEDLRKILQGEEKLLQAEEWFDKGYYHHRINKEYDKEIEAYTNAISLDPNLAKAYSHLGVAHYNLGLAYLNTGQKIEAIKEYQILKKLDSKLAEELLGEIYK